MPSIRVDDADSAEDEVKVFTADPDHEEASETLVEDKHDVTYQAECEQPSTSTAADANGRRTPATVGSSSGANLTTPTNAGGLPNGTIGSSTKGAFSKPSSSRNTGGRPSATQKTPTSASTAAADAASSAAMLNGYMHLQQLNGMQAAAANQLLLWPGGPYGAFMGQQYSSGMPPSAHSPLFLSRFAGAAPGSPSSMVSQQQQAAAAAAFSALQLEAAAKSGSPTFATPYMPVSPSFDFANSPAMAIAYSNHLARFSPMLQAVGGTPTSGLSPIHSPHAGAAAMAGQYLKQNHEQLLAFKHSHLANTAVSLPSSFRMFSSSNPLASIASLRLPQMTQTVTNLANTLASAPSSAAGGGHRNHDGGHRHHSRAANAEHRHKKEETHIKKPLNAFMLFMKENRQRLMEEKGYKERQSAELNKELGRLWHTLTHQEQQKYYDMARMARKEHQEKYPGWSARDNYAVHKKKKRKRDKSLDNSEMKKCRARFGLNQTDKWCKHCKRKKKCLWFREGHSGGGGGTDGGDSTAEELSPPAQVSSTTQGSPPDVTAFLHQQQQLLKASAAIAAATTTVPMSIASMNGGSPAPAISSSALPPSAKKSHRATHSGETSSDDEEDDSDYDDDSDMDESRTNGHDAHASDDDDEAGGRKRKTPRDENDNDSRPLKLEADATQPPTGSPRLVAAAAR